MSTTTVSTKTGEREGTTVTAYSPAADEAFLAELGGRVEVTFEEIDIDLLNVDDGEDGYQRVVNMDRVEEMCRTFNPLLLDPMTVSMREDGSYWVSDGGHRRAMYQRLKFKKAWCRLVYGLSREEEARLFIAMAKGRRSISQYAAHRAKLVARDEDAMAVEAILSDEGFKLIEALSRNVHEIVDGKRFPIAAVDAVNTVYNMDKGVTLRSCLQLIRRVWRVNDPDVATERFPLIGLGRVLSRASDAIDPDRLDAVLSRTSPTTLKSKGDQWYAVERDVTKSIGYAMAIVMAYNKGLRTDGRRIPEEVVR